MAAGVLTALNSQMLEQIFAQFRQALDANAACAHGFHPRKLNPPQFLHGLAIVDGLNERQARVVTKYGVGCFRHEVA